MRYRTVACTLLLVCAVCAIPPASYAREGSAVGYLTTTQPNGGGGSIPCAVWYPAVGGKTRAVYDFGRVTRTGSAFKDARPDTGGGPYPLVVYSHGYSGCSVASAYLCEALSAAGFVVAAPDHTDDLKVCSLSPGFHRGRFLGLKVLFSAIELGERLETGKFDIEDFRYRFSQIKATIDYVIKEGRDARSPLFGLVNPEHVGAVGHSLGAFSVMVAAGARDVGVDFPIDAVVAMSGPGGDAFTCADMKRIGIPAMLMYGTREANRREKAAGILAQYRCLAGPKFLMGVAGGDHLTFSEGIFSDSSPAGGLKREADARHDLISRYVTAFFSLYLAGEGRAGEILKQKDPGLDPYYCPF